MPDCPDNGPCPWSLSERAHGGPGPALNMAEIAELINRTPKIPRRELKCHPIVVLVLRACSPPPPEDHTWYAEISRHIMNMPIFEDEELPEGQWEVYEDGEKIYQGNMCEGSSQ